MLEFNEEHKIVDLSTVKERIDKVKRIGKFTLCGIALSSMLLLSGCNNNFSKNSNGINCTAVTRDDVDVIVIDLTSHNQLNGNAYERDTDGNYIVIDDNLVICYYGDDCYEKAIEKVNDLVGEDGKVIYYVMLN